LLGCDHNYQIHNDYLLNLSGSSNKHFYKDEDGVDDFEPRMSTEEFFLSYHIRWKQYRLMREYLESRGCYIYNATEGGILDVFPRVTLVGALAGHHERKS
jgi:hypothetical protein